MPHGVCKPGRAFLRNSLAARGRPSSRPATYQYSHICHLARRRYALWSSLLRGQYPVRPSQPANPRALCPFLFPSSALRDRRFAAIEPSELPHLSCTVSLLCAFERGVDPFDWDVGTHGLLLEFKDPLTRQRRTATFLPEVGCCQRGFGRGGL